MSLKLNPKKLLKEFEKALHIPQKRSTPKPAAQPAIRAKPTSIDGFDSGSAMKRSPVSLSVPPPPSLSSNISNTLNSQPAMNEVTSTASAVTAGASVGAAGGRSPYYMGRIHADGRTFVGENNEPFQFRSVSEFLLPRFLNDKSRSPEENEKIVADRLDERLAQGYSTVRVFGTLGWSGNEVRPFDDWESYKANAEKLVQMAEDRGMYVEWTALCDVPTSIPKDKIPEYVDFVADLSSRHPNTFVELSNESFKNGVSHDELYDLAKRFKQRAPSVMLAGSSPAEDPTEFGKAPFDYVTLHSERADGDDGWRWVRHMREGEDTSGQTGKPVVQDEPMGSSGEFVPGRRDNNPQHFRDAALVTAVTGQGFTFHTERGVTTDPYAKVAEPGADQTNVSDLVPPGMRGYHFVNGQWADSPFDVGDQFEKSVLRVFTKMKDDKSGFITYPVAVKGDTDLKLKNATHLTVVDVNTKETITDRDFASGEVLRLPAGSDVLIYGGNVDKPQIQAPVASIAGWNDPVGAQTVSKARGQTISNEAAQEAVRRIYRAALGRDADPSGLDAYTPDMAKGYYSNVELMLTSDEFNARRDAGLTAGKLASGMYQELLGRKGTTEELEKAVQQIQLGRAGQVMHDLVTSAEFQQQIGGNTEPPPPLEPTPAQRAMKAGKVQPVDRAHAEKIVQRLYHAVFNRDVDPLGFDTWVPMVQQGRLPEVANALVLSGEFNEHRQKISPDDLGASLYRALLDREPDADGLTGYTNAIRNGGLANALVGMVTSPEYREKN